MNRELPVTFHEILRREKRLIIAGRDGEVGQFVLVNNNPF